MGAFAAPALSRNDGMPPYAQVGSWQVRVDPAVSNGCFASQCSADGTGSGWASIRSGTTSTSSSATAWTSLEEGKTYRLRFVFDQAKAYDSDLDAGPLGDWVALARSGLGTIRDGLRGKHRRAHRSAARRSPACRFATLVPPSPR
jgi:hypothetical protein